MTTTIDWRATFAEFLDDETGHDEGAESTDSTPPQGAATGDDRDRSVSASCSA